MEKNQRNPRRRLNSLILLVAFTAVMLIVSTYAWFTAQKNVTLGNLKGKVSVAEGLEISLDALNWSQEIDFSDENKYGADRSGLKKLYGPNGTPATGDADHNIIPSELVPVSTTGKDGLPTVGADGSVTTTATTADKITLYNGTSSVSDGKTKLTTITAADDTAETDATKLDFAGYYAIDLFLRNSSRIAAAPEGTEAADAKLARLYDKLQLNTGSSLSLQSTDKASTGLQNTVRVAFALYESTPVAGANSGDPALGSVDVLATQAQIIKATTTKGGTGTAKLRDVAIWEPNAYDHVDQVVNSQKNDSAYRISFTTADAGSTGYNLGTHTIGSGASAVTINTFTSSQLLPTYAIGKATATDVSEISHVYDWNAGLTTNKLEKQVTLKTGKNADFSMAGTAKNLVSVQSSADKIYKLGKEEGVKNFYIPKNQVCRVRMYVWLEGQDIDCVNQASHGGGIELDVGLIKDVKDADILS